MFGLIFAFRRVFQVCFVLFLFRLPLWRFGAPFGSLCIFPLLTAFILRYLIGRLFEILFLLFFMTDLFSFYFMVVNFSGFVCSDSSYSYACYKKIICQRSTSTAWLPVDPSHCHSSCKVEIHLRLELRPMSCLFGRGYLTLGSCSSFGCEI